MAITGRVRRGAAQTSPVTARIAGGPGAGVRSKGSRLDSEHGSSRAWCQWHVTKPFSHDVTSRELHVKRARRSQAAAIAHGSSRRPHATNDARGPSSLFRSGRVPYRAVLPRGRSRPIELDEVPPSPRGALLAVCRFARAAACSSSELLPADATCRTCAIYTTRGTGEPGACGAPAARLPLLRFRPGRAGYGRPPILEIALAAVSIAACTALSGSVPRHLAAR